MNHPDELKKTGLMVGATCGKGHDLSVEGAFTWRSDGRRDCRLCAMLARGGKHEKAARLHGIGGWA